MIQVADALGLKDIIFETAQDNNISSDYLEWRYRQIVKVFEQWFRETMNQRCKWCGTLLVKRYDRINFKDISSGYHTECLRQKESMKRQ